MTWRIVKALWNGLLMAVLLLSPIVGAFTVGLLLFPICVFRVPFLRQFCENSKYVEFGFAWITIRSWEPFLFYWAWYSVVAYVWFRVREKKRQARSAHNGTGVEPNGKSDA